MCCFFTALFLLGPRAAIVIWWLLQPVRWNAAFDTFIVPFLGFIFLPWTTLAWAVAYAPVGGVTGFGWFIVIFAFAVDLMTHIGSAQARRQRKAQAA